MRNKPLPPYQLALSPLVVSHLERTITTFAELREAIAAIRAERYGGSFDSPPSGLQRAIEEFGKQVADFDFYGRVLPFIQKQGLTFKSAGMTIPILENLNQASEAKELTKLNKFTRQEVAAILSLSFFSAVPSYYHEQYLKTEGAKKDEDVETIGHLEFYTIYPQTRPVGIERVKCQLSYFYTLEKFGIPQTEDLVEFHRVLVSPKDVPDWNTLSTSQLAPFSVSSVEKIEDSAAGLHLDFANEDLHIGTIIPSCTQEEVLFSIRPELFVGLIFCERMSPNEAIVMRGASQFSTYTGYLDSFMFAGPLITNAAELSQPYPVTPDILAIDACVSMTYNLQFSSEMLFRDLMKLYVGFRGVQPETRPVTSDPSMVKRMHGISTGQWGCGIFGGDPLLKFLQQWMVASFLGQEIQFSAFKNQHLATSIQTLGDALLGRKASVADIYALIVSFDGEKAKTRSFETYLESSLKIILS